MPVEMALVPLAPGAKLSSAAVRAAFAAEWPGSPGPDPVRAEPGQMAFRVGEAEVVIGCVRAPIPWGDLAGPCRTTPFWPRAEADLRGHTGHLIVTAVASGGPVALCRLLTQACVAVLAACDRAPGVFWAAAGLLVPSEAFRQLARAALPDEVPLPLWVDGRVGTTPGGRTAGFTAGLAALGHMEFETQAASEPPVALRERLLGLADYVLRKGPVIGDGDTVGGDADERIRVVYADSAFGRPGKVMRLEYGPPAGRRGLFGRRRSA